MNFPDTSEMVEIKTWKDTRPFAGKVVAYTTSNDLYLPQTAFCFDKKELKYGYISFMRRVWGMRQFGFELHPLVKEFVPVDHREITDFELKILLQMRDINLDEIFRIEQAIGDDAAFFEHMESKELFFEVLKNALQKHGLQRKDFQKTKLS